MAEDGLGDAVAWPMFPKMSMTALHKSLEVKLAMVFYIQPVPWYNCRLHCCERMEDRFLVTPQAEF